uniref:Uncharacterized protein n=1 Tax=Plectus sambesii TaxID=2011161 RepID=A0A914XG87_9BILA
MDQIKREFHQIEDVLLPNFKRDQKFAKKDNEAINSFKIAENDLITRIRELFTKLRTFIDGAHFHRYGNNGNAAVNDAKQLYNQLCKM